MSAARRAIDIRASFQAHGEVSSVQIIMDKMTGRSRGFGFVEMPDQAKGTAAISALNLQEIKGRAMTVNEAKPKTEGGGRGGFGGGGGGVAVTAAAEEAGAVAGNENLRLFEKAPWKRGAFSFSGSCIRSMGREAPSRALSLCVLVKAIYSARLCVKHRGKEASR